MQDAAREEDIVDVLLLAVAHVELEDPEPAFESVEKMRHVFTNALQGIGEICVGDGRRLLRAAHEGCPLVCGGSWSGGGAGGGGGEKAVWRVEEGDGSCYASFTLYERIGGSFV